MISASDPYVGAVQLAEARAAAELELLARLTPAWPRGGLLVLKSMRVSHGAFTFADTRAIFVAVEYGAERTPLARAQLARLCLDRLHCWDESDEREFFGGSIWGPGPLAALWYARDFDADVLSRAVRRLQLVDYHQRQLAARTSHRPSVREVA